MWGGCAGVADLVGTWRRPGSASRGYWPRTPSPHWIRDVQQTTRYLRDLADDVAAVRERAGAGVMSCGAELTPKEMPPTVGDLFAWPGHSLVECLRATARPPRRVGHSGRMRRRVLPLVLASLLAVSGCVSVNGTDDKPAERGMTPGASAPRAGTDVGYGARPLTQLPSDRTPSPAGAHAADGDQTGSLPYEPRPEEPGTGSGSEQAGRRHHPAPGAHRPRAQVPPVKPDRREQPRMPRTRPAPAQGGPPGTASARRIEMAELCRASKGVTGSSVTGLCNGTQGR